MAEYYKTKITLNDSTINYLIYSKPITKNYKIKRESFEKSTEGSKSQYSINRSRNEMIDLIDSNVNYYSKFITLTTKDPIYKRVEIIEIFKNFKKHFHRKFGKSLSYVGVIEKQFKRQKNYNLKEAPLHIHMIVFYTKKIDFKKLKTCWPYGSVDLKKVDYNGNLSIYLAKYLTKESMDLNKKGFIRSHNLKKPQQYYSTDIIIPNEYTYHKRYLGLINGIKDIDHLITIDKYEVRINKLKNNNTTDS